MSSWRTHVACPERFDTETADFLDKYAHSGKLKRSGTFTLHDTIDELVPFQLLPIRIKRLVNLMPLTRDKFKTIGAFKAAITKLYIYGYLPDSARGIDTRNKYWVQFEDKWCVKAINSRT